MWLWRLIFITRKEMNMMEVKYRRKAKIICHQMLGKSSKLLPPDDTLPRPFWRICLQSEQLTSQTGCETETGVIGNNISWLFWEEFPRIVARKNYDLGNVHEKKYDWGNIHSFILFLYKFKISIGPCARSDWAQTHVLSEYKTKKKRVLLFCACKICILTQMKKPKPCITLW